MTSERSVRGQGGSVAANADKLSQEGPFAALYPNLERKFGVTAKYFLSSSPLVRLRYSLFQSVCPASNLLSSILPSISNLAVLAPLFFSIWFSCLYLCSLWISLPLPKNQTVAASKFHYMEMMELG